MELFFPKDVAMETNPVFSQRIVLDTA